ncbi:lytic transglycosylase domain-containing protein [Terrihabitans rhizophilus]|uniref:Transglycosylase SLT domain-containing protein n=1 Tax=Terrihabitans rhizophilus TaxID=3092662 RepID=A0ABU4RIC6_9HYPH|nr:transglycosylase SLT domain-containing protein [Terrihabitans sp. PJ23]MDX6804584.1 transglycosylase SLT domain-containing protein [Terrihabitans sp. PJ23]
MIHLLALPILWLTLSASADPAGAQEAAAAAVSRADLKAIVRTTAAKAGMPPELADAVATVESNYNTGARGYDGEIGMMQILPSTARMLGFYGTNQELADPATNARYAVEYLSSAWRKASGDICTTVMKYRAGHGETRFSHKSVAYCVRVRELLAAQGFPVTGVVPPATFGDSRGTVASAGRVRSGGPKASRGRRSKIDWARYERRVKEIDARMSSGLTIMR